MKRRFENATPLALALCLSLATAAPPAARAEPATSAQLLQLAIEEAYDKFGTLPEGWKKGYSDEASRIHEIDRRRALSILDDLLALPIRDYNDAVLHLSADYRQFPERRHAIDLIAGALSTSVSDDPAADALREKIREQLKETRTSHPVMSLVKGVTWVFVSVYGVQAVRGMWVGRGKALTSLQHFRLVKSAVTQNTRISRMGKLKMLAAGSALGGAEVAYQLRHLRLDLGEQLVPIREEIARLKAEQAEALLAEARELRKHGGENHKPRLEDIDASVTEIQRELEHLFEAAAELRPLIKTVAPKLAETRDAVCLLNGNELVDGDCLSPMEAAMKRALQDRPADELP